jgi:hypothetical protein
MSPSPERLLHVLHGNLSPFEKLEPVSERIVDVKPFCSGKKFIVFDLMAVANNACFQGRDVAHMECRMRLSRGGKIGIYADVELVVATLKPDPAPLLQLLGLLYFFHTEDVSKKPSRRILAPRWCGKLHMIDTIKRMVHSMLLLIHWFLGQV